MLLFIWTKDSLVLFLHQAIMLKLWYMINKPWKLIYCYQHCGKTSLSPSETSCIISFFLFPPKLYYIPVQKNSIGQLYPTVKLKLLHLLKFGLILQRVIACTGLTLLLSQVYTIECFLKSKFNKICEMS